MPGTFRDSERSRLKGRETRATNRVDREVQDRGRGLDVIVLEGPFALALAAGMAAALNPCGFAMLPAYLTYFVGTGTDTAASKGVPRALAVSAVLTAGFVAVFGLWGLITTPFVISVQEHLPWVTIVIGIFLAGLGVAMTLGKEVTLPVPRLAAGGGRELPSMFLFGVSYAVASLSCTIGPFLAVTTSAFRSANYVSGVSLFVTYGLGMGLFVSGLTLAVALAQSAAVSRLRSILPYVSRISGVLMLLAGLYVAWYGWWELRNFRGDFSEDPLTTFGENVRITVDNWISDAGAGRLAVIIGSALVIALVTTVGRRRRSAIPPSEVTAVSPQSADDRPIPSSPPTDDAVADRV